MSSPTVLVGYMALFTLMGFVFLFVNLGVGYFLRPDNPHPEKKEIYECGEPTIGSSFVQFDLRFYVVALIFIVFDAEVAFLFPLSTLFGKAAALSSPALAVVEPGSAAVPALTQNVKDLHREMGLANVQPAVGDSVEAETRMGAKLFVWSTFAAINIFFIVLLIGFAYEWKTGSLDWVKAVSKERAMAAASAAKWNLPAKRTVSVLK